MMNYKQFEIYNVNLNPTKGSEQSWIRPCIILQTNAVSDLWRTTIIAVFTTKKIDKIYPYEVLIKKDTSNWLLLNSKLKLDQIRVIDKTRIQNGLWKITNKNQIAEITWALDIILDIGWNFR